MLETICICDDGGYPLALERMNGARRDRAPDRLEQGVQRRPATSAPRISFKHAAPTAGSAGQRGRSASSFRSRPGSRSSWAGFPVVVDGEVIGGVGAVGREMANRIPPPASPALQALADRLGDSHDVLVAADIKK